MSAAHRHPAEHRPSVSAVRMGIAGRLAIAAAGCVLLWTALIWALG